jgi:hypothetical protein
VTHSRRRRHAITSVWRDTSGHSTLRAASFFRSVAAPKADALVFEDIAGLCADG